MLTLPPWLRPKRVTLSRAAGLSTMMVTLSVFSRACLVSITGCGHESPRQSTTLGMGSTSLSGAGGDLFYCGKGGGDFFFCSKITGAQTHGALGEGADGLVGCRRAVEPWSAHDGVLLIKLHGYLRGGQARDVEGADGHLPCCIPASIDAS